MILRQPRPPSKPGFLGHTESSRPIGPFLVSQTRYASGVRLQSHAHRHPFISFVIAGAYTETCERQARPCPPGTLGFHPASEEHSDHFARQESVVLGIEIGGAAQDEGSRLGSRFLNDGPEVRLAWHIAREFQQRCPASDLVVECLATELVSGSGGRRGTRGTPRWLATALELADDRFSDRLRLADVAAEAGVHPVHLARQFRVRMGCTYGEYVRRIRLARALEQLRRGSRPIAEVAVETGFADQSHLTRLMTALLGITPAAYRRQRTPAP
jgi:AraC family transcriptional regulator